MFSKIILPVDLQHADKLKPARKVALDLAKHYGASLRYIGVTSALPGSVAHTPEEFGDKLEALAQSDCAGHGVEASAHVAVSHDPAADLEKQLLKAITEQGGDLVVMATHVPNLTDGFWSSNGGWIANHADVSVFLVRAS